LSTVNQVQYERSSKQKPKQYILWFPSSKLMGGPGSPSLTIYFFACNIVQRLHVAQVIA